MNIHPTTNEQFFSHIMARTSYILPRWSMAQKVRITITPPGDLTTW